MDNRSGAGGAPAIAFRPDIEGLRAVAVGLVVALHAGVTMVSGGYIGVDVFFVVSGFLITSLLIREERSTGRVSIPGFYARRARRILPAACLVIAVTVLVSYQQLGALLGKATATDGIWSALFAADFRFIAQGTNYFTSALPPSPLQNYWSLAVEEQFYFVWPTVLFGLMVLGRRSNRSMLALRLGLLVVVAGSLALSVQQSVQNPTNAYFSPFTRAWELGAGALIAVAVGAITRLPATLKAAATWVGLALIAVAAFTFDATTVFPGYAALIPVGGTVLVIAGGIGDPPGSARMLLGLKPLRWLGLISFSVYLWHWPVLTIAEERSPSGLSGAARVVCLLIIMALSVATYMIVEHPLRTSSILQARIGARTAWTKYRNALLAGAVAIVVAVSVSVAVGDRATSVIETAASGATTAGSADAATSFDASPADLTKLDRTIRGGVQKGLTMTAVPADLDPPVLQIGSAFVPKFLNCQQHREDVDVKPCAFGDTQSKETIVVLGDSHAMEWMPALDAYGRHAGYRVLGMYKAECPVPTTTIWAASTSQAGGREPYPQCAEWRENALARINEMHPTAVILAYHEANTTQSGWGGNAPWLAGLRRSLTELGKAGAPIIQIGNNPGLPEDPGLCLSRPGAEPARCVGGYLDRSRVTAELALVRSMGGTGIDIAPWFCVKDRCPAVVGRWLAYSNSGHISAQFVRTLAPLVAARLRKAGLR
jgi:peptidoglycan/LPS O-acetylase OafA/YrhL